MLPQIQMLTIATIVTFPCKIPCQGRPSAKLSNLTKLKKFSDGTFYSVCCASPAHTAVGLQASITAEACWHSIIVPRCFNPGTSQSTRPMQGPVRGHALLQMTGSRALSSFTRSQTLDVVLQACTHSISRLSAHLSKHALILVITTLAWAACRAQPLMVLQTHASKSNRNCCMLH